MKPGQVLCKWWQDYVAGRLTTPQSIIRASRRENPDKSEDRFTSEPMDHDHWDVPDRLRAPAFLTSETYARQGMRADWQQVNPQLRLWAAKVCIRAKDIGIPLYIHSAFRTKDEQETLLKRGVTKVGYPLSAHNIGEAVDIVHGIYHWEMTPLEWSYVHYLGRDELRKLNALLPKSKRLSLNWGGDDGTPQDKFRWDPAHWEILDYRDRIAQLVERAPVHMTPSVTVARHP